jgi:hypothetical protein
MLCRRKSRLGHQKRANEIEIKRVSSSVALPTTWFPALPPLKMLVAAAARRSIAMPHPVRRMQTKGATEVSASSGRKRGRLRKCRAVRVDNGGVFEFRNPPAHLKVSPTAAFSLRSGPGQSELSWRCESRSIGVSRGQGGIAIKYTCARYARALGGIPVHDFSATQLPAASSRATCGRLEIFSCHPGATRVDALRLIHRR